MSRQIPPRGLAAPASNGPVAMAPLALVFLTRQTPASQVASSSCSELQVMKVWPACRRISGVIR